jgi:hypothetical protein
MKTLFLCLNNLYNIFIRRVIGGVKVEMNEQEKELIRETICSHCDVPSYYPSVKVCETLTEAQAICREQGVCAHCEDLADEIIALLPEYVPARIPEDKYTRTGGNPDYMTGHAKGYAEGWNSAISQIQTKNNGLFTKEGRNE